MEFNSDRPRLVGPAHVNVSQQLAPFLALHERPSYTTGLPVHGPASFSMLDGDKNSLDGGTLSGCPFG